MEKDKYDTFIDLATDAIEKCLQQLTKLDPNKNIDELMQFARGLRVLTRYRNRAIKKDLPCLDEPPAKRPGIGLSRGFGEFECGDEVMDAIHKLERYYHSM